MNSDPNLGIRTGHSCCVQQQTAIQYPALNPPKNLNIGSLTLNTNPKSKHEIHPITSSAGHMTTLNSW